MAEKRAVFITGGTGFMGNALIPQLVARGHSVRALVRAGSEKKLTSGCVAVVGDALKGDSYAAQVAPANTFVHLIGTHHPNPSKAAEFREVDLESIRAAVNAARAAGVRHFVYLSVAQPAPIMKEYLAVRAEGERLIREICEATGMGATFVRPWYVLGPGRRWPLALVPMYWLMEAISATRERAIRLGLVTREQMVATLVSAVENPPSGIRILETEQIRNHAR
ncbi:MAG: NAD(P)H-binding protein [Acidobacteria bacterium]|nr:NAD(P)H-binding protein [Acidobacteriota bacterium]